MKSNSSSSKGTGPKTGSNTAYTSSYAYKYKNRGNKPPLQNVKLNSLYQSPRVQNQSGIEQRKSDRQQANSFKKTSNMSKQNQLRIEQDQWIGQNLSVNEKHTPLHRHSGQWRPQNQQENLHPQAERQVCQEPQDITITRKPSDILIQQLQQDLNVYQHYRMLEQQYLQQLQEIKRQTDKIKIQCGMERDRISQSQQSLSCKRKKLKASEDTYNSILQKNQAQAKQLAQMIRRYEQKLDTLGRQHEQNKQDSHQQKMSLQNQLLADEKQNESLSDQLFQVQAQLKSFSSQLANQAQSLNQLQETQRSLLQDISTLQIQSERLQQQMKSISSPKQSQPVPVQVHKGYLQSCEKIFIAVQLYEAEQIVRLREEEKQQVEQVQRRKDMVKDKKVQISIREKRISQKNRLIDKLTQQIRQKSTTLLNLYQQQG